MGIYSNMTYPLGCKKEYPDRCSHGSDIEEISGVI